MPKGKKYTEIDDFCIINFYKKVDIQLLVSVLNRTKGAIRFRAVKLGVAKPIARLSKKQKEFIKKNKDEKTQQAIADELGVTRDAVAWQILYSKNG